MKKPLVVLGSALIAVTLSSCASAPAKPAEATAKPAEAHCGGDKAAHEGSCGGEKKAGEAKAGESSCGESSCGASKTPPAKP